MSDEQPEEMTLKEAAVLIGVKPEMVRRYVHRGLLEGRRAGLRRIMVTKRSVDAFLASRRMGAEPPDE